jgi:hypothetical protein
MSLTRSTSRALLALLLLVAGARGVAAQGVTLADGDRIRVDWRDRMSNSAEGRYREGTSDSLVFVTRDGVRLAVPRSSVDRVQVALGVRSRAREYAFGGALGGGIVGAVIGASTAKKQSTLTGDRYDTLSDPTTNGIVGALVGGVAGAFVGSWIGKTKTTDRWQDINPSAYRVSMGLRFVR